MKLLLAAAAALVGFSATQAQAAPTFGEVSAILAERCIVCHQGEAAPLGLRLDSYAGVMRGSGRGPVVRPKDAPASELVRRVRGESQPRMPLTGPPWLTDGQIATLEQWIAAGAPEGKPAAAAPAPARTRQPGDPVTYAEVAPILVGRCAKCHGANSIMGRAPEGYRLDNFRATLDASDRARVVPGNPEASELVRRIRGTSSPRMPFDGPPYLDAGQIRLIEQWIAQGARDADGNPSPVPAGARVRFRGAEELRGVVQPDGSIRVTRLRRR
ncbi:MAG TPA: c-type cytochrome domain-containing protein [Albitalea sp.]